MIDAYMLGDRLLTEGDLRIGGRNYLTGTSDEEIADKIPKGNYWDQDGFFSNKYITVPKKGLWTFSVYIKNTSKMPIGICYNDRLAQLDRISNFILPSSEGYAKVTFNKDSADVQDHPYVTIRPDKFSPLLADEDLNFIIKGMKLEFGNVVTDWTPNPQDVQDQIKNLQDQINELKK